MTTPTEARVLELIAAAERAKQSGRTDSDQAEIQRWVALTAAIHSLCENDDQPSEKLPTEDILFALSKIAGWYIAIAAPNSTAVLLAAGKFASDMLGSVQQAQEVMRNMGDLK